VARRVSGDPGFGSGNTVWSATSGVIGQWGSRGEPPHSGTWNAWLDGYGTTHTDALSQSVSLPGGRSTYTLSFRDISLQTSFVIDDTTLNVS
jgi:hypothetical protein